MTAFPLPDTRDHARLAQRLTEDTVTLVTQPTAWSGRINQAWALPVTANTWTALVASAFNHDPEPLLEVEVRLALHGLPPEGEGALSGHGLVWLVAQQQVDRFKANAALWQAVRDQMRSPVHAAAALDAAVVLLTPSGADPWGLKSPLYACFMRAWREGRLATDQDDHVVARFLAGPLALWGNAEVPHQALTFASEHADPSARLRRLGLAFQGAPEGFLRGDTDTRRQVIAQVKDTLQQGARLASTDPATVSLLVSLDPALLAQARVQSVEAPTGTRKRAIRRS